MISEDEAGKSWRSSFKSFFEGERGFAAFLTGLLCVLLLTCKGLDILEGLNKSSNLENSLDLPL